MINKSEMMSRWGQLLLLSLLLLNLSAEYQAKEANNQPLANLDKVVRQASQMRMDSVVDNKMASNLTNTLNEMAMNLRKMFMENRRLSSQIQEVMSRAQNVTGINATNTVSQLQQQTPNLTSLTNMANNMNLTSTLSRFQNPNFGM